jgi:pantetheine-phosphate adenylyltransferase
MSVGMNRRLSNKIETVFMMPAESYTFLSSKLVKEVFMLGGSLEGLIPDIVNKALREKFKIKK